MMGNSVGGPAFLTVGGRCPADHGALFLAPNATLAGSVRLGRGCSVWFGAVLRGDSSRIVVGEGTNVQDNAVLHTDTDFDVILGRDVTIGHGAVIHGCTIEDGALIGMHATVLNGAVVGAGSLVAAGALVTEGMQIPPNSLVVGVPAKIRGPLTDAQRAMLAQNAAHYVKEAALYNGG